MPDDAARDPIIEDVLGPLGARIMRAVWDQGEATVASVTTQLAGGHTHPPAYTTVMTVMGRLVDRGLLVRTRSGRQYVYGAAEAEGVLIDHLGRNAVDDLIGRFGAAAYRQFAIRLAEMDEDTRASLARLADEHEPER